MSEESASKIERGLDVVLSTSTSQKKDKRATRRELMKTLRKSGEGETNKIRAGIQLVDKFIPGSEDLIASILSNYSKLPFEFSKKDKKVFDAGGEGTLFAFGEAGNRKVLKVYRESLGLRGDALQKKALEVQADYEKIKSLFGHIPNLIPDEQFLLLHSPLLKKPAVASVQPFVEGTVRDFFTDFTPEERINTIENNPLLREQFIDFAQTHERMNLQEGKCLDLLGDKNLSIVEHDGKARLVFLDPHHMYKSPGLSGRNDLSTTLAVRIADIKEVLADVKPKTELAPTGTG